MWKLKNLFWLGAFFGVIVFFAFVDFWPLPKAPGELVFVNGRQVHMVCMQPSDGQIMPQATILFESGGGMPASYWFSMQRRLVKARNIRVCSYDRSGIGWSESYPEPYSAVREAEDGYAALLQIDDKLPLIIAGHSLGGLTMRILATRVGERVKGMIYIDPTTITAMEQLSMLEEVKALEQEIAESKPSPYLPWPALRLQHKFFGEEQSEDMTDMEWEDLQSLKEIRTRKSYVRALEKQNLPWLEMIEEYRDFPIPHEIFSIVLKHSGDSNYSEHMEEIWSNSIQNELVSQIDNVSYVIVEDSDHHIIWSAPDAAFDAFISMIDRIK